MYWKEPEISKIYEALTAISDGRVEIYGNGSDKAKVWSSSRNKYYDVSYNPAGKLIMSNDNSAYYTGTLSWPMVAFLMANGKIKYNPVLLKPLKGIIWKEINQRYKNDFPKAADSVLEDLKSKGHDINLIKKGAEEIYGETLKMKLGYLGKRMPPPKGW